MELIVYVKETHEVCYKCEVCSKVDIINIKEKPLIIDDEEDLIQCPKCHSTQIQLMKRGWKITTGFINSSKPERACMRCKHKF